MSVKDKIKQILENNLDIYQLDIQDDSPQHAGHKEALKSGGGHFSISIVSDDFKGKNSLQRHRMVYQILMNEFKTSIHALAIKALTPEELKKTKI